MSKDNRTRVRTENSSEPVAPYRASDGAEKLKENFAETIKNTRDNLSKIYNTASIAAIAGGAEVLLNWESGPTKTIALLLVGSLVVAPQVLKLVDFKDLEQLMQYRDSLMPHAVDEGSVNKDANKKRLMPMSFVSEGRHTELLGEAFVGGAIAFLRILNSYDVSKDSLSLSAMIASFVTMILAAAAVFVTRRMVLKTRTELRTEMQESIKHIPVVRITNIDQTSGDEHEDQGRKQAGELKNRKV